MIVAKKNPMLRIKGILFLPVRLCHVFCKHFGQNNKADFIDFDLSIGKPIITTAINNVRKNPR